MMDMEMNAELERDGGSDTGEASSEGSSAASIYCTLEQDYARIRTEMKKNESLASYEAEYTRLFESLYKSQQQEQELGRKVDQLRDELTAASQRTLELEAQAERDAAKLADLARQIAESKSLADAAHTREQKSQQVVESLRLSAAKLSEELEQKKKQLGLEDERNGSASLADGKQQKEGAMNKEDRERLIGELEILKQRLRSVSGFKQELEAKLGESEQHAGDLQDKLDRHINELTKEKREREKADSEVQALQQQLTLRLADLQTAEETLKTMTKNADKQESLLREQVLENEKNQKEIKKLMAKQMSAKTEADRALQRYEKVSKELMDKNDRIKDLNKEIQGLKEDSSKFKSEKESAIKKLAKEISLKNKSEESSKRTMSKMKNAELEIVSLKRQLELERKSIEKLNRDKETAAKSNLSLEDMNKKLGLEIRVFEQTNRKMESSLEEMTAELNEGRRNMKSLEKERDRCVLESQELVQQIEECMEQGKLKRLEISDFQKQLVEAQAKIRQQQTLFEDVRAERNNYKKSLASCQNELEEAKNRVKNANIQINQLNEQIVAKESALMKHEFLSKKMEKEKEALRTELAEGRRMIEEFRHGAEESREEERRLRAELQEAGASLVQQRKETECALRERDAIGAQVVRRNDELGLQYGRARLLDDALARGERQYGQRLGEIKMLRLELRRLKLEKAALERSALGLGEMRRQLFQLERQLAQERLKVTALEEELQNPLNVHRWRNLEGTDPDTFELLRKIHILQKKVLNMSSEIIDKERTIKETEKLYVDLRETIAKQPGQAELLVRYGKTRRALRNRGKKMKCLIAELNMTLTAEHKFEIEKVKKELSIMKAKCLVQNKKRLHRDKSIEPPKSVEKEDLDCNAISLGAKIDKAGSTGASTSAAPVM